MEELFYGGRIIKNKGCFEGRAEGRTEGKAEGFLHALIGLVKDNILTLADAAERANMTVEEFESKTAELNI